MSDMSAIGATLVIEFGDGVDAASFVAVELDETLNLAADGSVKVEFAPGDEVWWWLQHDPGLRIGSIACTSGEVVDCGLVVRSRDQQLTWTSEATADLSYLPLTVPALTWYGNSGNPLRLSGRTLTAGGMLPCTGDVALPIEVHLYRFVPPPLALAEGASYRIVIVITLEAAA